MFHILKEEFISSIVTTIHKYLTFKRRNRSENCTSKFVWESKPMFTHVLQIMII